MAEEVLGSRDPARVTDLSVTGSRARPTAYAHELTLPVPGSWGETLSEGLRRGSVMAVEGETGSGVVSAALSLAAAATAAGEWAALVGMGDVGGLAGAEMGVALDRLVVIPEVPRHRWAAIVAALLEGMGVTVVALSSGVRPSVARRLAARVRDRRSVLVVLGQWPDRVQFRLEIGEGEWRWEGERLSGRTIHFQVDRRGHPPHRATLTAVG